MEHVLEGASGLARLVLVGAVVSASTMLEHHRGFYEKLPPDAREAIRKHEARGTFEDPEYGEAVDLFHRRYTCRLDPPDWLNRAVSRMDVEANTAMWGPPGAPSPARSPPWTFDHASAA